MLRQRRTPLTDSFNDTHKLLGQLLHTPAPSSGEALRPATLRSVAEQRRIALRSFLCRTWLDHTLGHAERLLLLIVTVFFVSWFVDGYGRDWLHQLQQSRWNTNLGATLDSAIRQTNVQAIAVARLAKVRIALPYTTPDMERTAPAEEYLAPANIAAPVAPADPYPNRLIIPTISVDTPVQEVFIENGAWQVADYAAGYHHGTALPGASGNMVMAGHAGLRGGVFRSLGQLQPGDEVIVETGGWRYSYRVHNAINVWPTQVEVMSPTPEPILTLITCTAWDTKRLVVVADLIDSRPLN
ncbi:MAG: sortase [Chloroflexales bacterium]|nr:sortase [Chloroflexales bacterium]